MNLEHYEFESGKNKYQYEFVSIGPRGRIRKMVQFTKLKSLSGSVFNLAFGDWNSSQRKLDDTIISNNGDTQKVLATIAYIIITFTACLPDAVIYIQGSNQARTRLYRMQISKYWKEISPTFVVAGVTESGDLVGFVSGVSFVAFAAQRK